MISTLAFTMSPWMVNVAMLLFIAVCGLMVLTVLIQKPQGGGLAGAFGSGAGSGQTAFGTKTGDALTVFTIIVFTAFLLGAVLLNFATNQSAAPAQTSAESTGKTTDESSKSKTSETTAPATAPATTPTTTPTTVPASSTPATTPATTDPKPEAPKTEAPKTEAPKPEAPKTDAPATTPPPTPAPKR